MIKAPLCDNHPQNLAAVSRAAHLFSCAPQTLCALRATTAMPLPTLPYKRPFFSVTLNPHEIEVRRQERREEEEGPPQILRKRRAGIRARLASVRPPR